VTPEQISRLEQAWTTRYRRPLALEGLGEALAESAPEGSAARAWGRLHQAMGQRAAGHRALADQTLGLAEAGFQHLNDVAGLRVCGALQGLVLVADGHGAAALQRIGDLGDWPGGTLVEPVLAHAAQFALFARAMAQSAAGRWDDMLRDRYSALRHARHTGDDGAIAHALADLASMQSELSNAEDALALAIEAVTHGERAGRTAAWMHAEFNRLGALLALRRFEAAAGAAAELLPLVDQVHPRGRESALILLARAHLHGGQPDEAQALLDRSVAERVVGMHLEWTVAQAELDLQQGLAQRARDHCEAFLARPAEGHRANSPEDLLLLHQLAAQAHERLGDAVTALRHARAELLLTTQVIGRSARAARLSMEIGHQLDHERWKREQAQARQQASEAERMRLNELNGALEAANLAKTRFLAAASHDLRQPVQALALNMAALEHEDLRPAQAQLVQRMGSSLRALGQMFDVLLDISRLDAGAVPVSPQALALRSWLRRLADDMAPLAAARGLALRLRLPKPAPASPASTPAADAACITTTDPVLLERCLRNLLDNAFKYTPRGGTVLLALRHCHGSAEQAAGWRIEVLDTGIGMSPEVQARAFDEFYQADNPERDRSRGLGLGLAIVQRLARLMGHGLAMRSVPGRGTRLSLTLPHQATADIAAAPAAPVSQPRATARLSIAVIDDDAEVRDGLQALLERWGHAVLSGAQDDAVLDQWRAQGEPPVHALITDLRLRAGRTGLDAAARLRQPWGHGLPVLVITGDVAPDRLTLLKESGLAWLPKPVMPLRLRSWLASLGPA
jgi:signal transduction histidine kinase